MRKFILALLLIPYYGISQIQLLSSNYTDRSEDVYEKISDSLENGSYKKTYSVEVIGQDVVTIIGTAAFLPEENFGLLRYMFEIISTETKEPMTSSPWRMGQFNIQEVHIKDSVSALPLKSGKNNLRWKIILSTKDTIILYHEETLELVPNEEIKVKSTIESSYFTVSPKGIPYASSGFEPQSSGSNSNQKKYRHKKKSFLSSKSTKNLSRPKQERSKKVKNKHNQCRRKF